MLKINKKSIEMTNAVNIIEDSMKVNGLYDGYDIRIDTLTNQNSIGVFAEYNGQSYKIADITDGEYHNPIDVKALDDQFDRKVYVDACTY